jgi:hypothetical protein
MESAEDAEEETLVILAIELICLEALIIVERQGATQLPGGGDIGSHQKSS